MWLRNRRSACDSFAVPDSVSGTEAHAGVGGSWPLFVLFRLVYSRSVRIHQLCDYYLVSSSIYHAHKSKFEFENFLSWNVSQKFSFTLVGSVSLLRLSTHFWSQFQNSGKGLFINNLCISHSPLPLIPLHCYIACQERQYHLIHTSFTLHSRFIHTS